MSRVSRILIASLLVNKPCYIRKPPSIALLNKSPRRTMVQMAYNSEETDYFEMSIRNTKRVANLLARHDPPCPYCNGCGYLDCDACEKGCWRCKNSKIKECPFCKGDGKGRPAYSRVPAKK